MFTLEMFVLFLASFQPIAIGVLAYIGLGRVASRELLNSFGGVREKVAAYRFYECAAYSRLTQLVRYGIPFLSLCLAYIVYDVDIMLLIAEMPVVVHYGVVEIYALLLFIALFILALWYDYRALGYS